MTPLVYSTRTIFLFCSLLPTVTLRFFTLNMHLMSKQRFINNLKTPFYRSKHPLGETKQQSETCQSHVTRDRPLSRDCEHLFLKCWFLRLFTEGVLLLITIIIIHFKRQFQHTSVMMLNRMKTNRNRGILAVHQVYGVQMI